MAKMFVTMTPFKFESMKIIRFERTDKMHQSLVHYVASGQHRGILVCKEQIGDLTTVGTPETQMEFSCIVIDKKTEERHGEKRRLKFWFLMSAEQLDRLNASYRFIHELIQPKTFPKDYVGFFKQILKQLHGDNYPKLRRIDLELIPLEQCEQDALFPEDVRPIEQVVRETLLTRLEEAYPNVLSTEDLVRILNVPDSHHLEVQLLELASQELIEAIPIDHRVGYRRKIRLTNHKVREMTNANHMQQVCNREKPTVAIITNLLSEKIAVDQMIEEKTTFVRYKTEGESNVYTIGNIGEHRVISIKLPMVGGELEAKISSANTTTRLLGAFQSVQHVLLVGVAGGVPHVYEFEKHSRLGDIVVGAPTMPPEAQNNGDRVPASEPTYIYCERITTPQETDGKHAGDESETLPVDCAIKNYYQRDFRLLRHAKNVLHRNKADPDRCEWARILDDTMKVIGDDETVDFTKPPADTDKLILKVNKDVTFDIRHPDVPEELARLYPPGVPAVRLGCIGSGRPITGNDKLRGLFAEKYKVLCYDVDYDQVLESLKGNELESFLVIRGISDYADGRKGTQWQPYASLVAACFMKSVLLDMHSE